MHWRRTSAVYYQPCQMSSQINILIRDLRSFEIRFEFESDDSDSIRFESDGLTAPAVVTQTTLTIQQKKTQTYCCAVVIDICFMFMIFCLRSKRAYTLASTIGAIVQYCLRNEKNPHISACDLLSIKATNCSCDSIRDSIRTKISDSQVPNINCH